MASQQDLQELLRLMTVAKVPIKDAMMRVKALQAQNLRSIKDIAEATLPTIESAIPDPKAARQLHNACKARLKNPAVSAGSKRAGAALLAQTTDGANKRTKADPGASYQDGPTPLSPADFEASLALPVETDEHAISATTLLTNRAPLVLAFAAELLRYTMPEQPPSSRLSLAQAVVSANSRGKAVSIGIEKGPSADQEGWGHGQPRVQIMGREVTVLKRGGYEWKGEGEAESEVKTQNSPSIASSATAVPGESQSSGPGDNTTVDQISHTWSASSPITSRDSTFIVRATKLATLSQRQASLQALFTAIPNLRSADHNAWAYRVKKPDMFGSHVIREDSFDDGERGSGDFMLKIMRETNTIDTLVVMTRWYGGTMLGPDRWRIIRTCLKEALAERSRATGEQASMSGEAVWGLDLEAMRSKTNTATSSTRSYSASVVGMPVHRPESARAYLLKSFAQCLEGDEEKPAPKKKTAKALEAEKEENLGRLLGAIRMLYDSWAGHLSASELDRRAWSWYMSVRPEVESGPSGWGAKGKSEAG
ncbi:impact protein-like protein [Apiospora aurea]|uniref:Impact protein-like protein n=1 Tax=Apiospora aurea TaxID=335848 RepID=A0ABR1QXN4_9PEZI